MFSIPAIMMAPTVDGGFAYPYTISNSCMFDAATNAYMSRGSGGSELYTGKGTLAFWIKRSRWDEIHCPFSIYFNTDSYFYFYINAAGQISIGQKYSGGTYLNVSSTEVLRDCSGWYNIVLSIDHSQATTADRVKVWVNNYQLTLAGTFYTLNWNNLNFGHYLFTHHIGSYANTSNKLNGYLADFFMLPDVALEPSDFGQTVNGIWCPKEYTGSFTHTEESVHLEFADDSNLGDDTSGNTNDYNESNMGTDHQVIDTPTNNHATLDWNNGFHNVTYPLHEGGLEHHNASANWLHSQASFLLKTGKWYWEMTNGSDSLYHSFGICAQGERSGDNMLSASTTKFVGYAEGWGIDNNTSVWRGVTNNAATAMSPNTLAADDIIQIAFDADANKLWFGINNTWVNSGDPAAGTNAFYSNMDSQLQDLVPTNCVHTNVTNKANFGQRTFAHTPPSGFQSLCAANLPEPETLEPRDGFDVVLYEGTGAELVISGLDFTPDFVWIKNRDAADPHHLFDVIRGATKHIESDSNVAQQTIAQTLKTWGAAGFTLGTDLEINTSGESYIAWCFNRGPEFGFDIQSFTGTGIAHAESHNLGGVPELMIVKNLTSIAEWNVYHHHAKNKTDPETDVGKLDSTNIWVDQNRWDDVAPTSTEFTVGSHDTVNEDGSAIIAYLWRSIAGFSKVFSFEGNNNALGPYVYCGFRPRFIILKDADSTANWFMFDTERSPINPVDLTLYASIPNADTGGTDAFDIFANGFKLRHNGATWTINGADKTIVGIAIADQPGKYSNTR